MNTKLKYLATILSFLGIVILMITTYHYAFYLFNADPIPKEDMPDHIFSQGFYDAFESCAVKSSDGKYMAKVVYIPSPTDDPTREKVKNGINQLQISNTKTGKIESISAIPYFACPGIWVESKIYLNQLSYETMGTLRLVKISNDFNLIGEESLPVNNYGYIDPDYKKYAYVSDTEAKDGSLYCTDGAANTNTDSGSTIRLLNFESGKIEILLSDKTKVFYIRGWSDDSKAIYYDEYIATGLIDSDGCPDFEDSALFKIDIRSKKNTQVE